MSKKDNRHEKKRNMKELLVTMFKIGCIGFGGGTALVPVIRIQRCCTKNGWSIRKNVPKDVIVANITPGAASGRSGSGSGTKGLWNAGNAAFRTFNGVAREPF